MNKLALIGVFIISAALFFGALYALVTAPSGHDGSCDAYLASETQPSPQGCPEHFNK